MLDKELFKLIGGNRKYVAYTVLLMVLGMLANIGITASVCWAVALLIGDASPAAFLYPALTAAAAVAVRYAASRCTGNLKDLLGRKVKRDLRERTYDKILKLGVRSTDGMSMAGLTQVSMEGIEQLDLYYSSYLPQFFFSMIAPLLLFAVCVWIDWRTSLVLLACVPLIPVSIVAVSKYAKKIFAKYWGKYTSMGDAFLDSVQGLKELKIFRADAARHVRMNASAEEFRKITMKVLVMQLASTTIMDLVAFGGAGAGGALSVVGLMNHTLAPAEALFLILVAVEFFLPLRSLGSAFHVAMNGASAGKKIISLLNEEEPVWGEKAIAGREMELKDVTFSYDGRRDVLKGVNMFFPAKGMTAIVGESGCGKSTLLKLLLRFWERSGGQIRYNGTDIDEINTESLYRNVTMVSQSTYLFDATIAENLRWGNKDATDAEIEEACKQACADEFIERFPDKYNTHIDQGGTNVSGGQKQRLCIARALLKKPRILILDDSTSAVDTGTDAKIRKSFAEKIPGTTVFIIAQRISSVENADHVIVLDNGRISGYGTPAEMLATNPIYQEVYNSQTKGSGDFDEKGGDNNG